MTNATAMTLVLLTFLALFFGAVVVILGGGRWFERSSAPKRRSHEMQHPQRAA